eukprot:6656256-Lingulodinium_polyedra.AAC.1
MYSSGSTSSTDSKGSVRSVTSKNRIEKQRPWAMKFLRSKSLVLDEERVVGTIIKPRAAELGPGIPANDSEKIANVYTASIVKNEEENTGNAAP